MLAKATGAHVATLYRDLSDLRSCGVPIDTQTVNGESRYTLFSGNLPPLTVTHAQLASLRLARRMLAPLEGIELVREFDALLKPYAMRDAQPAGVSQRRSAAGAPDLVADLDRGIQQQRRVRIRVRTRKRENLEWRVLDPLSLRHTHGGLYLLAFDHLRQDYRTFKVARISKVQKLADKSARHDDFDEDTFFKHAVKIWSGTPTVVRVRLAAAVANVALEYPLVEDQTVEREPDGTVLVTATVAGIVEATRWVLGWGKDAEALDPQSFRDAVAEQVSGAAARYRLSRRRVHRKEKATPPLSAASEVQ